MRGTHPKIEDRFFSSDGVRLRYVEAGTGEAVILLHGFLGNIENTWIEGYGAARPDVLPTLARRCRTIALDARGHGRSDKPHDPGSYGRHMADDVVALLDHLGIDRAHLVGYSMGSLIAAKVMCERPNRLRTVVLGGGLPYVPSLYPDGLPPALANIAEDLSAGRGMVRYILASTPKGQYGSTRDQAEHISRLILAPQDVTALAAVARAIEGLAVTETQLAANTIPTLALIGGQDDRLTDIEKVTPIMPNLRVQIIEGADHASATTHPEFRRIAEEFLANEQTQRDLKNECERRLQAMTEAG